MSIHEEKARSLKNAGNNCSVSLHSAFKDDLKLSDNFPEPRSVDGKCCALLTALKILEEKGMENKTEEFEEEFVKKFGYSKCIDLMTHERRCSDYVSESAKMIDKILK